MELEIKVMWCKGLTAFNFFQKLSIYAAVSLTSEDERIQLTPDQKQEQKTPVDEDNDGSPEWNYPMKFDLQSLDFVDPVFDDLSLLFEFRINGQLFGDKTIGEVRVPLKDLIQSVGGEVDRFVSYEVRNPEGKHNGIFDFSYKVIGAANTSVSSNNDVCITGYQHHDHHHHHQQKLNQSHDIDVNVNGYYHHQQQQFDDHTESTNSEIHMAGYHHHGHHHHHSNGSVSSSETERIQYPNIEFGDNHSSMVSAPSLMYPPPPSLSSLAATAAQYQLSAPDIYPPPAPQQTWPPPPQPHYPPPSHYPPPPPPPQPYVYPPPASQPQPYGNSHWGYHHHW